MFRCPVNEATRSAATKNHGVGAFEYFDALDVVQVTVILNIITNAVDEKIPGTADATQDRRFTVSFALGEAHTRNVPRCFLNALRGLVLNLFLGDY